MTIESFIILFLAGIMGGTMNAVAGGASLITFPAMMAVGLPPILANASNTVATSTGTVTAAIKEWKQLPTFDFGFWLMCFSVVVGGAIGGILLLSTEAATFDKLVPLLIFLGTLLFAFAPRVQKHFATSERNKSHTMALLLLALLCVAIYGGYFGAGLGVLVMATISAFTTNTIQTNNALKNLLGPLANFAAIPVFIWNDVVVWLPTLVLFLGTLVGAQLGVQVFRKLPTLILRQGIIAIGLLMTLIFAYRVWV